MHTVDDTFRRHDMVLASLCMNEIRHTGQNIADKTRECLIKNEFMLEKIVCCVRDDARNMQSASLELGIER